MDGDVDTFVTNMTWYSSNGTASHTHEIQNFDNDNEVTLTPTTSITLMGESDVGTNGKIIWKNVPTIITIVEERQYLFYSMMIRRIVIL